MTATTTAVSGALKRWKWRAAIVAVAIVAIVAILATRGSAAQSGDYRTAVVDTGDVTQTLTATGSIDSASRYDLTFQVGGSVDSVDVAVGDTVGAGQELATLDDSDLQDAVDSAQEALTDAESTLADDLDAQSSGTSSSGSSSGGSSHSSQPSTGNSGNSGGSEHEGESGNSGGSDNAGGNSADSAAVKAAAQAVKDSQAALLAQYDVAAAALETAKSKQTDAQTVCAAFTAMEATDDGAEDALAACQLATDDALTAQQQAADEQSTLMDAADALNGAVADLLIAVNGTTVAEAAYVAPVGAATVQLVSYSSARAATAGDELGGGAASGSSGSSTGVPSAEDILADEAEVTAAEASLAVAHAQLEFATLSTPVAGTVVAVGVAAGDAVSAGDTTTVITVIADNTYLVQLSVSLSQARMLAVGQAAKLTVLSDNQVVDGTVSSVSTVNTGNSFSQSYAVSIAVPDPGFEIRIGTATRMEITVASATGALVVPTSAVADATGDPSVQIVGEDGTAQTVSVTTGAVGAEYTEITSGLEKGQEVILADLSVKLSTGDDSSSSTGGLLSGLGDDSQSDQQFQGPGGGNFQPPEGFQGGGFGGPPSG